MAITFEAVYEDGVLKPSGPLPFKEHERVRFVVEPGPTWAERTAGMLEWTGDPDELRRLALDPEFDPQESA
jgi:predicted DNA-binding antitoxin AbrB/MazE fold protein